VGERTPSTLRVNGVPVLDDEVIQTPVDATVSET
jgi:hypothetical protein